MRGVGGGGHGHKGLDLYGLEFTELDLSSQTQPIANCLTLLSSFI